MYANLGEWSESRTHSCQDQALLLNTAWLSYELMKKAAGVGERSYAVYTVPGQSSQHLRVALHNLLSECNQDDPGRCSEL